MLAEQHADSSRVVGVLTKCDIADKPKEVSPHLRLTDGLLLT